jgi:hypothetical protein
MANIKLTELSELLSVDVANTILYAADLSVSPNVSHYLRVGSISSLTDYSIANAAFLKANTALSVGFNANTALNISNLGFAKANAAHIQSNTATAIGTSAFNSSNNVSITAQLAYNRGNTAFNHAQASFNLANTTSITTVSSFNRANSALVHATAAFNYANTIIITPTTVLSQAAFNKANNAIMKAGDNITGIITAPTAALATSNNMLATTQFVRNEIAGFSNIRGFISFNPTNGAVFSSKNLSVSRFGIGSYNITLDPSIRTGNSNYAAMVGAVDSGSLQSSSFGAGTMSVQTIGIESYTSSSFVVKAIRRYNSGVVHAGGNDGNSIHAWAGEGVDPLRITVIVL